MSDLNTAIVVGDIVKVYHKGEHFNTFVVTEQGLEKYKEPEDNLFEETKEFVKLIEDCLGYNAVSKEARAKYLDND